MNKKEAQENRGQLEDIFNALQDGVIACDLEGKILRINAAALKLFEVASESLYKGRSYHRFLHSYQMGNGLISLEPWLMSLVLEGEASTWMQQEPIALQVRSGRKIYVNIRRSSIRDALEHEIATVYVFRDITTRYRKVLHIQRVHQAVSALQEAIASIPEHIDFTFPAGPFLLSPPVLLVAQQLVELIGHVLECEHVSLLAFGQGSDHLHYAVGRGFTHEQEQYRREASGRFLPTDFLDETVMASLYADQEVILPAERLRLPPEFREDFSTNIFLLVPLFLEKQLSGALVTARTGFESGYTPEEIELVRAVATETMFVVECLYSWHEQVEARSRSLVRQEIQRLTNDFLNLASHELNTPLTVIKGNIQLAQRRLAILKRELEQQQAGEKIERVQVPLAFADWNARLEERLIRDLIDDARIQAGTLELHLRRCDLVMLLRQAIAHQQRAAPGRTIVLDIMAPEQVPIIADADRIIQVVSSFLANALNYSPMDQPVTVRLTLEDAVAHVSVHNEGPCIPLEEQGRIWDRFYYTGGMAERHELHMSVGLGLYLCRVFIERHHGRVGVQSEPGHGATFWFTLPTEEG